MITIRLTLPSRDAKIELMGYIGQPLTLLGHYTVGETELSSPPDILVIPDKAADVRGTGNTNRSDSWEAAPLQQIVKEVAVPPLSTKTSRNQKPGGFTVGNTHGLVSATSTHAARPCAAL